MATDAQAIIAAVFPAKTQRFLGPGSSVVAELTSTEALIGQYSGDPSLPGYGAGDCAKAGGYTPQGTAIASKTSGAIGTGVASYGVLGKIIPALAPIPVIGQVIAGIAAIVLPIIGGIFKHHEQAVAREQGTLCSLIPQVNQTLIQTDAAVAQGALSVADADAQIEAMVAGFDSGVAGITQEGGNTCNAGCVMKYAVRAAADIHEQKYHNSPIYYLKHYWWVGALGLVAFLLLRK